jgi:hypothetical protein
VTEPTHFTKPFGFRLMEHGQSHYAEEHIPQRMAQHTEKAERQQQEAAKRLWLRKVGLTRLDDRTHS